MRSANYQPMRKNRNRHTTISQISEISTPKKTLTVLRERRHLRQRGDSAGQAHVLLLFFLSLHPLFFPLSLLDLLLDSLFYSLVHGLPHDVVSSLLLLLELLERKPVMTTFIYRRLQYPSSTNIGKMGIEDGFSDD